MPTVREIEQALFRLAPKEGAMDWDNVGQLLGDPEAEVRRVLVALDITEAVADEAIAENCQLIVSHHPVMNCKWLPVQTVRQDTPPGAPAAENPEERPVRHLYAHEPGCGPRAASTTRWPPRWGWRTLGRWGTRRGCAGWEHWQVLCLYRNLQSTSAGAPGQRRPLRRGQRPGAEGRGGRRRLRRL